MFGNEVILKVIVDSRIKRKYNCLIVICVNYYRVGRRRFFMIEMSLYRVLLLIITEFILKVMVIEIGDLLIVKSIGSILFLLSNKL